MDGWKGRERKNVIQQTMPLSARFKMDDCFEIGVDETGRGPFFGPIMAGAVALPPEETWTETQRGVFLQLRDSKKVAPKKRERLADELKACLATCAVGSVSAQEINERGIQWANREAFRRAVAGLGQGAETGEVDGKKVRLIIDGMILLDEWKGEQELVVEGDNQYIAVAGASILAKVTHDRWIQACAVEHPEWEERYHLTGSKGYGTARHREGIRLYGGCEQHRELFIQRWLPLAGSAPRTNGKPKKRTETTCLIQFGPPRTSGEQ
jgi:ribonuclease HII